MTSSSTNSNCSPSLLFARGGAGKAPRDRGFAVGPNCPTPAPRNPARAASSSCSSSSSSTSSSSSSSFSSSSMRDDRSGIGMVAEEEAVAETEAVAEEEASESPTGQCVVLVLWGASGRGAAGVVFPALWGLYRKRRLPPGAFYVVGCGRKNVTLADIRKRCAEGPVGRLPQDKESRRLIRQKWRSFWRLCYYVEADCGDPSAVEERLLTVVRELEEGHEPCHRLFYLSVPAALRPAAARCSYDRCRSAKGWNRLVVVGGPCGGGDELSFGPDRVYHVDALVGPSTVESFLLLRFYNRFAWSTWNREHVASVMLTFSGCDATGTCSSSSPREKFGVMCECVQSHVLNLLAVVAMERPLDASSENIMEEKSKVLRATQAADPTRVVFGRAVDAELEDSETESAGSAKEGLEQGAPSARWPTFACFVLFVDKDRWEGIPFIVRCGRTQTKIPEQVRVQYRDVPEASRRLFPDRETERDELIVELNEEGGISARLAMRSCRDSGEVALPELKSPEMSPLEEILRSTALTDGAHLGCLLSKDVASEASRIMGPLLQAVERKQVRTVPYLKEAQDGPHSAISLCENNNFRFGAGVK